VFTWHIEEFAESFKRLIKLYENEIVRGRKEDSIIELEKRRKDPQKILENLLCVKISKGYWRENLIKSFREEVNNRWDEKFFQSNEGKKILIKYLKKLYPYPEKEYNKLNQFLFSKLEKESIWEWINNNKNTLLAKIFPSNKSRMIFLRDNFSFEYIPIDRHEKRFLIRTGIFFYYLSPEINIPDNNEHYIRALKKFCKEHLSRIKVHGYDLGKNPGLVDKFIWLHCAKESVGGKQICYEKPNCKSCLLSDSCFLAIKMKTQI